MKVNVRGIWYDAEEEPILVELNNSDKKNIANMSKEFKQYICFPDNMDFKEVELKRQGCVSLVSRMYPDDTLFDYVVYVNVDGKSYSYGFGDAYDIALKTYDEQVANLG